MKLTTGLAANTTLKLQDGTSAPFSLSQAGQYDKETGACEKLTGWGRVCKARAKQKESGR